MLTKNHIPPARSCTASLQSFGQAWENHLLHVGLLVCGFCVSACGPTSDSAATLPTITFSPPDTSFASSSTQTTSETTSSSFGPRTGASTKSPSSSAEPKSPSSSSVVSSSSDSSSSTGSTSSTGATSSSSAQASTSSDSKACLEPCKQGDSGPLADCVAEFAPAPETANAGAPFNHEKMPDIVLGPPRGTMDTVSLGCGGQLTLGFVDPGIVDGPGPDFIVFENPFPGFPEPARVEVSEDGCTFVPFPCDPVSLKGCAGVTPVLANQGNDIDPSDPEKAGGDAFDIEDLGLQKVRFVRVIDVSREHWSPKGLDYCDPAPMAGNGKGGTDLDTIVAVPHS